ncbi:MAG: hypothetical protein ACRDYA_20125 [Egibacteraceae bacterium]
MSWTDTGGASIAVRKVRAPVVLRSVELGGKSVDDPTLHLGDETRVNPALVFFLRQQYGIDLDPARVTSRRKGLTHNWTCDALRERSWTDYETR